MWIFALALIILSLVVIGFVLYRKMPQIRMIDVETIPEERERQIKEQLILQKFQRKGGAKIRMISKQATGAVQTVSKYGRRAVQKLYKMEQYYQKLRRTASEGQHAYSSEEIKKLLDQAEGLTRETEYIPAEKIYIDIISHNPKNVDAYEWLGNLYMVSGQFDQAKETLQFALRLSPNDASVNVSLAELEMKLGNHKHALEFSRRAIEKRPKNPKYLDFYIEAALQTGALKDARKGIVALREVNPENKKITEFEERFQTLKDKYIQKTESPKVE